MTGGGTREHYGTGGHRYRTSGRKAWREKDKTIREGGAGTLKGVNKAGWVRKRK